MRASEIRKELEMVKAAAEALQRDIEVKIETIQQVLAAIYRKSKPAKSTKPPKPLKMTGEDRG